MRPVTTLAEARRLINFAVEQAWRRLEESDEPQAPRRIRGGAWAARVRCPDGKTRLLVERKHLRRRGPREGIGASDRFDVLTRDGFRCRYCGTSPDDGATLVLDHVVPVAQGGLDTPSNLVTACQDCNLGKGAKSLLADDKVADEVAASETAA